MNNYIIVPVPEYRSENIKAASAEEALAIFATVMDMDMNRYFKAVPAEEFDLLMMEAQAESDRQSILYYMQDELSDQYDLNEKDAKKVAKDAYDMYVSGKADLTQGECITEAYEAYRKAA